MVLNELSFQSIAPDVISARQRMSLLVHTARKATSIGMSRVLRISKFVHELDLAPGYTLYNWTKDANVDRDEGRFFRTLATKAPLLVDYENTSIDDRFGLSEFRCGANQAHGLGMAFLLETLALSLQSDEQWDSAYIELHSTVMDDDGELTHEAVEVTHASRPEHVSQHKMWVQDRLKVSVPDGVELWKRREELLPSLIFCDLASKQMQELHGRHPIFRFVRTALFEMESYCKGWTSGPFDKDRLHCITSTESVSTLQQFGSSRTFLCPDGNYRIFDWHVKINQAAWRIHFFPDGTTRKIIVGYIGRHLPTVKDPT